MRKFLSSGQVFPVLVFTYLLSPALAPAQPPALAPAQTPALAPAQTPIAASVEAPAKAHKVKLPEADRFKTVAAAAAHCPGDTVVWSSLSGKVYHLSASKYYGKTKHGAYVCEKDAEAFGYHASKR